MKKVVMLLFAVLFLTGFASAAYYGSFSFSEFLNNLDESLITLGAVFMISFGLIFFALSRVIKTNRAVPGVVSAVAAFLIMYWINKSGFDIEGLFFDTGISADILYPILIIITVVLMIILAVKTKLGFGLILSIIGGAFIALSFTDLIYAKAITFIFGAIILGLGIWRISKILEKRKEEKEERKKLKKVLTG